MEKEDYVLKCHVRSERRDVLDKLQDLPVLISSKLSSSIMVDFYSSFANASTLGKKGSTFHLAKHSVLPIYWGSVNCEKYMKNCTQGSYLSGTMTVAKVKKTVLAIIGRYLMLTSWTG